MKRPYRSPIEVPDLLKDHITDKVVCEIGCMEGDLLMGFAKHAKKVYGLELNADRYDKLREVESRFDNIEVFYRGVSLDEGNDVPEADLYYFWITPSADEYLINKIKKGKIACMTHGYHGKNKEWFREAFDKHEGTQELIKFTPKEDDKFARRWRKLPYDEKTPLMLGILNKR
jgi:hypothetical protein